nr:hypothetical protein [bacterium]
MPTFCDSARLRSACIFVVIFLLLLAIYYPSFRNPPRSDYWPAFWAFRLVDAPHSPYGLGTICNYDPFGHGTFRPLFYVYLYLEYRMFGSWFAGNHLLSFGLYFLCLILFYRLAVRVFRADPEIAAVFTALLAFLFSHFDIVTWTFHLASLAGFAFMLGGFLLFASFHRTGDPRRLAGSVLLFLPGMFSYEVFAPWPAVLVGVEALYPARGNRSRRAGLLLVAGAVLAVYICYLGAVLLSRGAASYMGRTDIPSVPLLLLAAAGVFFNLLYNSVAVNLLPILPIPATVADNVDMGGMLLRWSSGLYLKIIWAGAAGFCLCAAGLVGLRLRKRGGTAAALGLLLY